jgi:hypothetical protein
VNGYDEWKTRTPWDDMSPMDEARAVIEGLEKENDRLLGALDECLEWFEDRQDADCDQDGYIPNAEMKMAAMIREILERRP